MKNLFLFFLVIFPIFSYSKTEINDSSDYFVIFYNYQDSSSMKDSSYEQLYSFKTYSELEKILTIVPDSFDAIIIRFDSIFSLPNIFFKFKQIEYLIIETSVIYNLGDNINQLENLKELLIYCDEIYYLPYSLIELKNLSYVEIVASKYYSKKLRRKIKRIVKKSKSKFSYFEINWFICYKDELLNKIECIDVNKY